MITQWKLGIYARQIVIKILLYFRKAKQYPIYGWRKKIFLNLLFSSYLYFSDFRVCNEKEPWKSENNIPVFLLGISLHQSFH